jgi:hypothetical protein
MCVARSSGVRCGPIVGLDVCGVVDSVSCLGRLATRVYYYYHSHRLPRGRRSRCGTFQFLLQTNYTRKKTRIDIDITP